MHLLKNATALTRQWFLTTIVCERKSHVDQHINTAKGQSQENEGNICVIKSLCEKILLNIPSKSTEAIPIKKRTECRKYTELIKDLSMQMIGIIKHVKEDLKTKEVEITQLKESNKNLNFKDNRTTNFINHNINYAEAIKGQYQKSTNFNIKISKLNPQEEKNIKDMLKTEINPKHCNMNIINMKPIKTGDVIIEWGNKKDLDKLKLAILLQIHRNVTK
ncbi:hypothetical protein ILUMI_16193 [Ignelater luminosus]|uniref:Uncharacterized protein n=1 Tax=Ignelater luminosus TaxID=2038154 RepID=A0A8K0G348_IGNLU|nr:hypothetical protein ILUMI_16193 [Ignelater luminosus]